MKFKKIKEIFDENGWKYYLVYGTLLGAIRHKGFIPWDDGIDKKSHKKMYRLTRTVMLAEKIKFVSSDSLIKTIGKYLNYLVLKKET